MFLHKVSTVDLLAKYQRRLTIPHKPYRLAGFMRMSRLALLLKCQGYRALVQLSVSRNISEGQIQMEEDYTSAKMKIQEATRRDLSYAKGKVKWQMEIL